MDIVQKLSQKTGGAVSSEALPITVIGTLPQDLSGRFPDVDPQQVQGSMPERGVVCIEKKRRKVEPQFNIP
jgi:hypothetical protein